MGVSAEYQTFVKELFGPFGPVTIRRMFGGAGVYHDGVMLALIAGQSLYLKADERNRADFEKAGARAFTYTAKGRTTALSYWEVPEALYDDPDAFAEWARKAFDAAVAGKAAGGGKGGSGRRRTRD